jgi:hypothetical protein
MHVRPFLIFLCGLLLGVGFSRLLFLGGGREISDGPTVDLPKPLPVPPTNYDIILGKACLHERTITNGRERDDYSLAKEKTCFTFQKYST